MTIADLEPLLLEHLGADAPPAPKRLQQQMGGELVEVVVEKPPPPTPKAKPPARPTMMSRLSA